jgi:hypothetical protein
MEKPKSMKWLKMSGTFTNTVNTVFKGLTVVLILVNFIMLNIMPGIISYNSGFFIFAAASAAGIVLVLFLEPGTYEKHPAVNFFIDITIALCFGFLFFSHKTYILLMAFFTNIIGVSTKMSALKSIVISFIYFASYAVAMAYKPAESIYTMFTGSSILFISFSVIYICHYFSSIERKRVEQDEEVEAMLGENVNIIKKYRDKEDELEQTYWNMVETLIAVIAAKDTFTGGHSVKVCEYSVSLAKKVGLNDEEVADIMKASILHDIGKMGIPDSILLKPGSLSNEEYGTMMNHPEIGCGLLTKVKGLERVLPMILYHHEKLDGTGYPYGLSVDKIPLGARIIAIADSYDAMTSNRPYRKALLKKEAKKRLLRLNLVLHRRR